MSDLDTGKERLENWAAWAKADNLQLDYPKKAPYARLYQAEAGDVWDGEPMDYPIDEIDAKRVEDIVVTLPIEINRAVRSFYLLRLSVKKIARFDSTTPETVMARLDHAASEIGRMAYRRAG